jgi:hypothetical protein
MEDDVLTAEYAIAAPVLIGELCAARAAVRVFALSFARRARDTGDGPVPREAEAMTVDDDTQ